MPLLRVSPDRYPIAQWRDTGYLEGTGHTRPPVRTGLDPARGLRWMQMNALEQIHMILAPLLRAAPIIFSYRAPTRRARQSHAILRAPRRIGHLPGAFLTIPFNGRNGRHG